MAISDNTPVLIGAGQIVEREATGSSPMQLASRAATAAIADAIGSDKSASLAQAIDTVAVIRLFSDMGHLWPCPWGRSNNPPQSIAAAIGANPLDRIYTHTGGNEPQSRLIEFAQDIARGERDVVLLAGAEALKNQRHAQRNEQQLNWEENFDQPLNDRGFGDMVASKQEISNGLNNVAFYYGLIEQAQRHQAGRSVTEHQQAMAELLASFSKVAANNPYAQFTGSQSVEDILTAAPINHLYSKRMIAQDSVNQGAALLLCSVGKAKQLGIAEDRFIYLHGMAEGTELLMTERPDPALSPVANRVLDAAINMAGISVDEIQLIDIYSCFPCAVTAVATHLGLPTDGITPLTLTGGLPYFGGPGNNYSMHGIAEAVRQLREQPSHYALVTCNGGMLSKHAAGVYSCLPSKTDWATVDTKVSAADLPRCAIAEAPQVGKIISYLVYPDRKSGLHGMIIGADGNNEEHFVAITSDGKNVQAMINDDPTGKKVSVAEPDEGKLIFTLEEN